MRFSPSRALAARWLVSSGISLLPAVLSGQLGPVAGTVTSRASGAPVADVQVTVAGTTLRALTDASGRFRFSDVPGTMVVLQARRIGFRAAEDTIRVGDENVRIALEEKVLELSQVVVTGTPTATARRELGIAVSRIDAASVTQTAPINDVQSLLNGRAAGVLIQVITKRGTPGPARWDFTLRQGVNYFSNPEGRFPTNYQLNGTGNLVSINLRDLESQVGDIFRTGHVADYQASVSGGSSVVRYYVAGGTELQGGAEPTNDYRHTSGRANLVITPSDRVTLSANVGYVSGPTHVSCEAGCGGRMFTTFYMNPQNLGTFRLGFHSGLPWAYDEEYHFGQGLDRFTGSIQLQHHPVKWFTHRLTFGVDRTREENSLYQPRIDSLQIFFGSDALGFVSILNHAADYTTLDYAAVGTFDLTPSVRSSTSLGAQFYHAVDDTVFADGLFFPAPGLSALGATTGTRRSYVNLGETKSLGFYGQEQVAWRDRLFLTAGLRSDDQSTFGANFNRVYYPKASASWVISEEPFWKSPFFNQVRLRAAYGESGRAPPYNAAVPTYTTATGLGDMHAVPPPHLGNPDLGPERGKEIELGFDAGFWNDRLGLEFTYYRKRTTDEILMRQIAPSIGFSGQQYINAGAVQI